MSTRPPGAASARSALMKAVKRKNTAPELAVRRYLHSCGLRYGLHRSDLPGQPDIVLSRRGTVVFVHGCFWHGHGCAHGRVRSKTDPAFWDAKIEANRQRDQRKSRALRTLGWTVETVWECQSNDTRRLERLAARLKSR